MSVLSQPATIYQAPPHYSSVVYNDDPPPYPDDEEPPPSYFSVVPVPEESLLVLNDHICQVDNGVEEERTSYQPPPVVRKRPLAPRLVAWCDILTNLPIVLIFCVDFVVKYRVSFYSMWIFMLNLVWIHGAYQLHQSADLRKRKWERKELTATWRKFNIFFLVVFGCLAVFISYLVTSEKWPPNASVPLRVMIILMYFIPFIIRVVFFLVIANYIRNM